MPTEPTTTPGATVSGAVAAGLFFGVIAGIVFGAIGSGFLLLAFIFVPGLFVIPLVLIFIVAAFRPAAAVGVFIGFFLSVGGQISYHLNKSAGGDLDRNELASAIAAERREFKANGPLLLASRPVMIELHNVGLYPSNTPLYRLALNQGIALQSASEKQRWERAVGQKCLEPKARARMLAFLADGLGTGAADEPCLVDATYDPDADGLVLTFAPANAANTLRAERMDLPKHHSHYVLAFERKNSALAYVGSHFRPTQRTDIDKQCLELHGGITTVLCDVFGASVSMPAEPGLHETRLDAAIRAFEQGDGIVMQAARHATRSLIASHAERAHLDPSRDAAAKSATLNDLFELIDRSLLRRSGDGLEAAELVIKASPKRWNIQQHVVEREFAKICPFNVDGKTPADVWHKIELLALEAKITSEQSECARHWLAAYSGPSENVSDPPIPAHIRSMLLSLGRRNP